MIPSPTMMTAPAAFEPYGFDLLAGVRSASTSSTPMTAPTAPAFSSRSPVTITIRWIRPAQRTDRAGCVGTDRVLQDQRTGRDPVDRDEHRERAVEPGPAARHLAHPGRPVTPTQLALPTATRRPATSPRIPCPGTSSTCCGSTAAQPRRVAALTTAPASTCPDTWSSDAARRRTSSDSQTRPGRRPTPRAARGDSPGLVEQQRPALGQPLQHPAALDHHAPPRRHRQAGHQGDRCGQDQRAGVATTSTATARTAPPPPTPCRRRPGSRAGTRARTGRRAGQRAPWSLRFRDQADDPRIGTLLSVAVARRSNGPPALTTPLRTCSCADRSTGRASPVSADSSSTATAR